MFNFDDLDNILRDDEDGNERFEVVYGAANKIAKYAHISRHFLIHIVDLDPDMTFISDLSTLSDFWMDEDVLEREIFLHYGIDIDDIKDGNLVAIFKRIEEEGIVPWRK